MTIKDQFPIFQENKGLVYLDNAATTQKPKRVIDSIVEFYSKYNANVHRGLYPLSEKATEMYEHARQTIAKFINAEPEEIIFVGGTTDAINLISNSLVSSGIVPQYPKVLLSEIEHHSNLLPWQKVASKLAYIPMKTTGTKIIDHESGTEKIDETDLFSISPDEHHYPIEDPFDILALSLVSNVTGSIANIKDFIELARFHNTKEVITIVDAAQAIGHIPVDVKQLDVDFLVFSGHKMYGPTGVGVIYGKKELLERMEPFRVGGGMIREVDREKATWAPLPEKFEAGTPPIADAIALAEAVRFIEDAGFEYLAEHEQMLRRYLVNKLQEVESIKIFHPKLESEAIGVISFSIEGVHPHDIAEYLGKNGICVRAGHHCTQILHREVLQIPASVRVSLGVYNDEKDIDKFIEKLHAAVEFFRK